MTSSSFIILSAIDVHRQRRLHPIFNLVGWRYHMNQVTSQLDFSRDHRHSEDAITKRANDFSHCRLPQAWIRPLSNVFLSAKACRSHKESAKISAANKHKLQRESIELAEIGSDCQKVYGFLMYSTRMEQCANVGNSILFRSSKRCASRPDNAKSSSKGPRQQPGDYPKHKYGKWLFMIEQHLLFPC